MIRAGVISAGAWSAATHIPALLTHSDVELTVVTSPDPVKATSLQDRFGFASSCTDWQRGLEHDLDIVVVSSPPVVHERQVIAALQSGAHVLCEKPFAINAQAAAQMVETAETTGRKLLVGFGWNHTPIFERAHSVVASGELGAIEHVTLSLSVNTRDMLIGEPVAGWEAGAHRSDRQTYQDPAVSAGGAAAVSMSHGFGLLHHLVERPFTSVFAMTYPQGRRLDLHDAICAQFSGGASASIACGSAHQAAREVEWYLQVYADRAQMRVDSTHNSIRIVRADGSTDEPALRPDASDYLPQGPTHALVACARGADVPLGFSAQLGALTVQDVCAVYESALAGRAIAITA